jgi:hypothetical protein
LEKNQVSTFYEILIKILTRVPDTWDNLQSFGAKL